MILMMSPRSPRAAQAALGLGGDGPPAGFRLARQSKPFELLQAPQETVSLSIANEAVLTGFRTEVDHAFVACLGDEVPIQPGEAFLVHFRIELLLDVAFAL
jgi:hypothetical protein